MKPFSLCVKYTFFLLNIYCILLSIGFSQAYAIPVFARKYETSCTTCHVAFPKLNAFGEAFRIAGYQIPEGDEEFIKQEPILLGNEAYKRVWPEAIWPSTLSPSIPLSFRAIIPLAAKFNNSVSHTSGAESSSAESDSHESNNTSVSTHSHGLTSADTSVASHADESSGSSAYTQFSVPTAVNIYSAGNIGDNISLWFGAHLFDNGNPGTLGKLSIQFNNLLEPLVPHQLMNIRAGYFVPSYLAFDHHRNITYGTSLLSSSDAVNGAPKAVGHVHESSGGHAESGDSHSETITGAFSLGAAKAGSEIYGLIGPKFEYTLGVLNGNSVDVGVTDRGVYQFPFYARSRVKFGGMGFDGSFESAGSSTTSGSIGTLSSDDNSVIIGFFGYWGMNQMRADKQESLLLSDQHGGPVTLSDNTPATFISSSSRFYENMITRYGGDIQLHISSFEIFGQIVYGKDSNPRGNDSPIQSWIYFGQIDWTLPWPWLVATARYEGADFSSDTNIHPDNARQLVIEMTALLRANFRAQFEGVIDLKHNDNTIRSDYAALVFDTSF